MITIIIFKPINIDNNNNYYNNITQFNNEYFKLLIKVLCNLIIIFKSKIITNIEIHKIYHIILSLFKSVLTNPLFIIDIIYYNNNY